MSLSEAFAATFGQHPGACASAPARVNLIGEHTDYNGGAVLPAALACRTHVALAPQDKPVITLKSTRFGEAVERPADDPKRGDWTDYATGAAAKARALGWLPHGAQLYIDSNVPDGAGVSSSAALITAILRASAAIADATPDPVEIAKWAREVENDYIGMPCGIMDQMAVGLADFGKALALDTATLDYDVIHIPSDWGFAVIHSGIQRALADGRYKLRFEECQAASTALGGQPLCLIPASKDAAIEALPDPLRKRARHVVSEHRRTLAASTAMRAGDLDQFAALMNASHISYSMDFEASTPAIDALVADALARGARGARLTGGGFGGCIVVLLEQANLAAWLEQFLAAHQGTWQV